VKPGFHPVPADPDDRTSVLTVPAWLKSNNHISEVEVALGVRPVTATRFA